MDLDETGLEGDFPFLELDINLEEGLQVVHVAGGLLSADPVLHSVQGILGTVEQSPVQEPEVVALDSLSGLAVHPLRKSLIQRILHDSLEEIVDGPLDLDILAHEKLGLGLDMLLLLLHEGVEAHSPAVLRQLDQDHLKNELEIVLDPVIYDIVDCDDQLFQLVEAELHLLEESVDVHRGPGESDHTRLKFEVEVFNVGAEDVFSDGVDHADDSLVLVFDEIQLVEVGFELFFL